MEGSLSLAIFSVISGRISFMNQRAYSTTSHLCNDAFRFEIGKQMQVYERYDKQQVLLWNLCYYAVSSHVGIYAAKCDARVMSI